MGAVRKRREAAADARAVPRRGGVGARLSWRERLARRGATARRRHQPAPRPAGAAGPRARGARRRARRRADRAQSHAQGADAGSEQRARHGRRRQRDSPTRSRSAQPVAVFGDYDVDGAASSALLRALPRPSRARRRASTFPTGCSRATGPTRPRSRASSRRARKLIVTVDCGTTSREPLGARRRARLRRRRHRPPPGRRGAAARVAPSSIPTARTTCRGSATCARRASCFLVLVATTRELRRRGFYAQGHARARPDGRARSRRARDRRRRGAAHRPQPRLRHAGAAGDALAAQHRPQGAERRGRARTRRRRPIISASSSARASTPAGASATPASARACSPARTRWRRRASPMLLDRLNKERRALEKEMLEEALARGRRARRRRAPTCRADGRLARLAQGHRRARREPPHRALPPARRASSPGTRRARPARARLAALRCRRRHRLGGARGRRRGPSRQGRRPRDGGRADGDAREARRAARSSSTRAWPRASARRASAPASTSTAR